MSDKDRGSILIRMRQASIDKIKQAADLEDQTVSAWARAVLIAAAKRVEQGYGDDDE